MRCLNNSSRRAMISIRDSNLRGSIVRDLLDLVVVDELVDLNQKRSIKISLPRSCRWALGKRAIT
jgi:hypothetical protein